MIAAADLATLRATYRTHRAAAMVERSISAEQFDQQAGRLAHELADGERITPEVWVRAAMQTRWP